MLDDLTPKQRLFVEHYLINGNATEAARQAGYKGNDVTLGSVGAENLRKPQIAKAIAEKNQKTIEKLEITQEMIIEELSKYAFRSKGKFKDVGPRDALTALTLLGNKLGMWKDGKTGSNLGDKQAIFDRLSKHFQKRIKD